MSPAAPPLPLSPPASPPVCYDDWTKTQGNLRCSFSFEYDDFGYDNFGRKAAMGEIFEAASKDECCSLASAADMFQDITVAQWGWRSTGENPITAWQFEPATDGSVMGSCVVLRKKFYQKRPASTAAQKKCRAEHETMFTYFRNIEIPQCTGFEAAVADVVRADGIDLPTYADLAAVATTAFTAITADAADEVPAAMVAKGMTADECCAACKADDACSAWQLKYTSDETEEVCVKVTGSLLLGKPDVEEFDVSTWAHYSGGAGYLYHRPAKDVPAHTTGDAEAGECPSFAVEMTKGKNLLAGDVTKAAALGDATDTIVWNHVLTQEGCCEIASRYACSENPVLMYQLVGSKCVLKRKAGMPSGRAVMAVAKEIAETEVTCAGCQSGEYRVGHIFYAENPTCRNAGEVKSPCATTENEGVAAGVCAAADEPCFFDVNCKEGGLGCNAAGYESCRFCGFTNPGGVTYPPCPGEVVEYQAVTNVDVPGVCPSACTGNEWETCFYDATCSNPYSPEHRGGLGCNAGGKGRNCRFCGFEFASGEGFKACPDSATVITAISDNINEVVEGTGKAPTTTGTTSTAITVEVDGTMPTEKEYVLLAEDERCEDQGYATIESLAECTAAAEWHGYLAQHGGAVKESSYWDRPYGCTWHPSGDVYFFTAGSGKNKPCTHRGYAGCFCRKPSDLEKACSEATGATCVATEVEAGASCVQRRGRKLQSYTTMTLTITKDASASTPAADALVNDETALAEALAAGAADAGEVRVNSGSATYTTTLTIVTSSNDTALEAAIALAAGDAMQTAVTSTFAMIENDVLAAAAATAAATPPAGAPCLTAECTGANTDSSSTLEGWVVAVIVVAVCATFLGFAAIVAWTKSKDKAATKGESVTVTSNTDAAPKSTPTQEKV